VRVVAPTRGFSLADAEGGDLWDPVADGAFLDALAHGLRAACTYFFHYELPRTAAWLRVVETRDPTCRTMAEEWF
jgi:uncharacterized protein (UPF0261 family)